MQAPHLIAHNLIEPFHPHLSTYNLIEPFAPHHIGDPALALLEPLGAYCPRVEVTVEGVIQQ